MARKKTREEKIKSGYRLQNFSLKLEEHQVRKDVQEFGYLSSEYVGRDLTKTLIYTIVILGLLMLAKMHLG